MTKQEVVTFLEKIKANYQSFSQEGYVLNEWYERLKDYDKEDVYKKFEEHLSGELSSQIPKIHFLTKYLTKTSEKGKTHDYKVYCSKCTKVFSLKDFGVHLERHNSIEYMKLHIEMFKTFNEEKLLKMPEEAFKKIYDQWVEKLCEVLMNKEEKTQSEKEEFQRLQNYIYSKAGMPISID